MRVNVPQCGEESDNTPDLRSADETRRGLRCWRESQEVSNLVLHRGRKKDWIVINSVN